MFGQTNNSPLIVSNYMLLRLPCGFFTTLQVTSFDRVLNFDLLLETGEHTEIILHMDPFSPYLDQL